MSIAFVFPGQGSQSVGMGCDVYEASVAARAVFEQADATLGFALTRLCFEGPEEALTATENAQPALLTVSVALLAALAEHAGFEQPPAFVSAQAACVAGHSLGEYSALVASGALDFTTALQLVRRRGQFMAEASEGAMAAIIGLDGALLEQVCEVASAVYGPVVIANYNSPGQLVISGTAAAVEAACAGAKARGAKRALPLNVSAAFHSPLMQAAATGLAPDIEAADVRDVLVPVVGNVAALPLTAAVDIRAELVAQITAPVRWIGSVEYMIAAGVDTFIEIGAGSVLSGLIKRIAPTATLVNVSNAAQIQAWMSR